MRKTVKNVMMVVPVLTTSCQVSLNRNKGPVTSPRRITPTARLNVDGLPVTRAVAFARRVNRDPDLVGRTGLFLSAKRKWGCDLTSARLVGDPRTPSSRPNVLLVPRAGGLYSLCGLLLFAITAYLV
jgi:hypothetical protein